MPRSYSAKLVALAVGVERKWLDSLLSRHELPGVARSRQGVERRISDEGLLVIEVVRMLNLDLGVSLAVASGIARAVLDSRGDGETRFAFPSGLVLLFPLGTLQRRLLAGITDAVESFGRVPRGRPPRGAEARLE